MDLVRWSPFRGIGTLRDEVDRLFERFVEEVAPSALSRTGWTPALDLSETKDAFIVRAELPGMDPNDIHVNLRGDMLIIKGEKHQEKEEHEENYHRIERSYGAFSRTIPIPAPINEDALKASFKDGVLKVTLPKTEEQKAKTIQIDVK